MLFYVCDDIFVYFSQCFSFQVLSWLSLVLLFCCMCVCVCARVFCCLSYCSWAQLPEIKCIVLYCIVYVKQCQTTLLLFARYQHHNADGSLLMSPISILSPSLKLRFHLQLHAGPHAACCACDRQTDGKSDRITTRKTALAQLRRAVSIGGLILMNFVATICRDVIYSCYERIVIYDAQQSWPPSSTELHCTI